MWQSSFLNGPNWLNPPEADITYHKEYDMQELGMQAVGMFLYRLEDDVVVQICLEDRTAPPVF